MKNVKFRERIAILYTLLTAFIIAILLATIYFIVHSTVYSHLDDDLNTELEEISNSLVAFDDSLIYTNRFEWSEQEHSQVEINPTFIQVFSPDGKVLRKTGNLKAEQLTFLEKKKANVYVDGSLSNSPIRQVQAPFLSDQGKTVAYISVAISKKESSLVLDNLKKSLLISYPLVLLGLFIASRIIAGRAIAPIDKVIKTAEKISKENLSDRIEVPERKDELHTLSVTINDLLERLEDVVQREKQFTADASHELRTPLSIIKGTLEVLNRKPREIEQYMEKIDYVIGEVDRVSSLIDSLLELARLESGKVAPDIVMFDISGITQGIAERFRASARSRKMELDLHLPEGLEVNADPSMCDIMISNIISNAIKYSLEGDKIEIKTGTRPGSVFCSVTDHGAGIDEEHIQKIFDRFYRADSSRGAKTGGKGLGLSITKKLADLQNVTLELSSTPGKETVFTLLFPATS